MEETEEYKEPNYINDRCWSCNRDDIVFIDEIIFDMDVLKRYGRVCKLCNEFTVLTTEQLRSLGFNSNQ